MSKDGIVCLLMILNVNTYANVILERSLRANEGHIGVNESIMTVMKQIWTQMYDNGSLSHWFSHLYTKLI